jgi:tRNA uridine 5-carboxymethylaminomethyl modification enzyme
VGERLSAARPATLGAAGRLPGVTPAAVDLLAIHLARVAS